LARATRPPKRANVLRDVFSGSAAQASTGHFCRRPHEPPRATSDGVAPRRRSPLGPPRSVRTALLAAFLEGSLEEPLFLQGSPWWAHGPPRGVPSDPAGRGPPPGGFERSSPSSCRGRPGGRTALLAAFLATPLEETLLLQGSLGAAPPPAGVPLVGARPPWAAFSGGCS
jgi:hypothetical protein